jgi:hypothetical protein
MKKVLIGIFAFAVAVGFSTTAQAAFFTQNNADVDFWVVDAGDYDSGSVTIGITNLTGAQLQYFYPGAADWTNVSTDVNTSVSFNQMVEGGSLLTQWRLSPTLDRVGDLTFDGGQVGGPDDLYTSLLVDWDETAGGSSLVFNTANYSDGAMSPVPIASSMVLLGSGLFGLLAFGYRRRSAQE